MDPSDVHIGHADGLSVPRVAAPSSQANSHVHWPSPAAVRPCGHGLSSGLLVSSQSAR